MAAPGDNANVPGLQTGLGELNVDSQLSSIPVSLCYSLSLLIRRAEPPVFPKFSPLTKSSHFGVWVTSPPRPTTPPHLLAESPKPLTKPILMNLLDRHADRWNFPLRDYFQLSGLPGYGGHDLLGVGSLPRLSDNVGLRRGHCGKALAYRLPSPNLREAFGRWRFVDFFSLALSRWACRPRH